MKDTESKNVKPAKTNEGKPNFYRSAQCVIVKKEIYQKPKS